MSLKSKYEGLAQVRAKLKAKGNKKAARCVERQMAEIKCEMYNQINVFSLKEDVFQMGNRG